MSKFTRPQGLYSTRLLCPWNSPGNNTGVGCHSLFHQTYIVHLLKKFIYLFIHLTELGLSCCTQDLWLPPWGSSALTRDQTQASYVGSAES